ncbi:MAG TPA: hypothetical protein VJ732_08850, partial [Bryobacteraceae bacterium]|nr:hypothetical protein [Bryobacteraceae bacterium]
MRLPMQDPRVLYSQLLADRRRELAAGEARHRRLGYGQLGVVTAALAMVWVALVDHAFSIGWVVLPACVFVGLLVIHDRVLDGLELRRRATRYFERALARLDGNWAGQGETGERYLDPHHLYAQDLDLFGKGSLFELLCTARTRIGEETLAGWLLHPAAPPVVRERQQAVEELRNRVDLREDLAVLAEEAHTGIEPAALAAWGEAEAMLDPRARVRVWALTGLGFVSAGCLITLGLGLLRLITLPEAATVLLRDAFLAAAVINLWFVGRIQRSVEPVVAAVEGAAHQLGLLSQVLVRLEREQFRSPLLARLRASLDTEGLPPSQRFARLRRLIQYL